MHVAVEKLASSQNMDTTRKLAYVEGITCVEVLRAGLHLHQLYAISARKLAFGKGGSKKDAFDAAVEEYGTEHFLKYGKAKFDVSDSLVLAKACRHAN